MAGNRIQIRRGDGTPSDLMGYELGWDRTNKILYITNVENNAGILRKIGGEGAFLLLSGGTLTGNLTLSKSSSPVLSLKNTTMDTAAATMSATQYNSIYFRDKNDLLNGFLQGYEYTNGNTYMVLATRRRNTDNTNNVQNSITLTIAANGTAYITVSHPAAWRTGLGVVNIAGDTMTGDLTISKTGEPALIVNNTVDHKVGLIIGSSSKNGGLWDYTNGKWIVYSTTAGAVTLNGNATSATSASTVARATFGDSANGTHDANAMTSNGLYYYSSNGPASIGNSTADGAMYVQAYNTNWIGQIAQDYRNGNLFVRGKNNGTWQSWKGIVSSNLSRRIYVTTSASVPSGAVAGDIVLVKA